MYPPDFSSFGPRLKLKFRVCKVCLGETLHDFKILVDEVVQMQIEAGIGSNHNHTRIRREIIILFRFRINGQIKTIVLVPAAAIILINAKIGLGTNTTGTRIGSYLKTDLLPGIDAINPGMGAPVPIEPAGVIVFIVSGSIIFLPLLLMQYFRSLPL